MKILIACEESQAICKEFRKLGHEAYSCDILPCSGGHPEWHIQGDAIAEAYSGKYDLMVAHPPCTYLSNVGAPHLFRGGILNQERYEKGMDAKEFFMTLLNAPIDKIAVENPTPTKIFGLPQYTQVIQPFQHGDPYQKRTCLWLKNLPQIVPTNIVKGEPTTVPGNWYNKPAKGVSRSTARSKTFPGIAKAIATQWGLDS